MNIDISKFTSRKFITSGSILAIIIALDINPQAKGILLAVLAGVYIIVEGIIDIYGSKNDKGNT
jgi:uncharacterized membrane protein HdeD (DUF308 family)